MRPQPQKKGGFKVELLEGRELLSTVIAESEPNNRKFQADAISFDEVDGAADVTGRITDRRDQDFFSYTAAANGQVGLNFEGANGFVGKVSVEDAFENKLFESEPNDGVNSGTFAIQAGQQIFIRIRPQSSGGGGQGRRGGGGQVVGGDYTLHLSLNGVPGGGGGGGGGGEPANVLEESESNNTKGAADRFDLGTDGTIQLQGTSQSDRDRDFFVFTPTSNGTINVAVQSPNGNFAQFEVETPLGITLFETEPRDGVNAGSFQVTAGSTYFIRMRSRSVDPAAYLVDLALV